MNNLKKETEIKGIAVDCELDTLLIRKIEIFLKNNNKSSIWASQNLNSFFEGSLNNYKVRIKSFEKIPNYLRNKRVTIKQNTFEISESSFQIYNGLPLENRNETIEKILNWWLSLSSKHLWPDCIYCIKENKATNGFCNLDCIKEYLKNRGNYNLCKHPIRDLENNIIFWEQDCVSWNNFSREFILERFINLSIKISIRNLNIKKWFNLLKVSIKLVEN